MRRLLTALRRALCKHAWTYHRRLPEVSGKSAVEVKCIYCGGMDRFYGFKNIG